MEVQRPEKEGGLERFSIGARKRDTRSGRHAGPMREAPEGQRRLKPFGMPSIEGNSRDEASPDRRRIGIGKEEMMFDAARRGNDHVVAVGGRKAGLSTAPMLGLKSDQALGGKSFRRGRKMHRAR